MAGTLKFQALVCGGALVLSAAAFAPATAFAQAPAESLSERAEDGVRLSGAVQLPAAYDPIDITVPDLIAAPAGPVAPAQAALQPAETEGSASALPWYQRFTVAPSEPQILWSGQENFEVQAGDRWGVTLGYSQGERSPQNFDLEDFRAGAFFELTERVRLGGQLRFTSPEEEIFGEETEDRAPEVRFESAFKF
ncbi:MAG: NtrZ family periplasmic regulatory protein [Oceanicaulis sp.]